MQGAARGWNTEEEWIETSRFQTCKIKISMLEMEIGKIRHDMQASIDSKLIGIECRGIREEWLMIAAGDTRSKTEILIDELLFRYRKELALKDGAMNMTKTLKAQKKTDQKCVNDVSWFVQLFPVNEWITGNADIHSIRREGWSHQNGSA